jgi:hypothetical protein
MMQAIELGISTEQSEVDLPRADHIRIGDLGPVMRASGNGVAPMKFRRSAKAAYSTLL